MSQVNQRASTSHNKISSRCRLDNQDIADPISSLTRLYVISYLILFAILGTLARVGLQYLTSYASSPLNLSSIWPNFSGCFIMGFLIEDCILFNYEKAPSNYHQKLRKIQQSNHNGETNSREMADLEVAKREHTQMKKTIPLYIGLTTGFCGSFTSFSSFARDIFLELTNKLQTRREYSHETLFSSAFFLPASPRNPEYSLMAAMAVVIVTLSLCVSAWLIGTRVSRALESYMPSIEFKSRRKFIDCFVTVLALTSWIAVIILAVYSLFWNNGDLLYLHRPNIFSLVLAPLGCIARFYLSSSLNSKIKKFPLGTFAANTLGTGILGATYGCQRIPLGSMIGCQVLQGIQDGFCGCLTTVSSWITEFFFLHGKYAFFYVMSSIVASLCSLIIILGSILWTRGFMDPLCAF